MDKNLEIEISQKNKIRNIFRLYGFPEEIINHILHFKQHFEDEETIYFNKNCIIHECLNMIVSNKTIKNYKNEKKLYNEYYKYAIPKEKGIIWSINVEISKSHYVTRNRILVLIELLFLDGFIKTSFAGRVFDSSLKEKLRLFKKKSYIFIKDAEESYFNYEEPIIIDPSGELVHF
jgi:hypothetical protein